MNGDYDMSIHTNPDAAAWAKFFREQNPDCNVPDDIMLTWFANAMMAMHDYLMGGGPLNGDHAQYRLDDRRYYTCQTQSNHVGGEPE